ncbi:MAG: GreA/GreB family elongation factor [Myxococcota bacterium]
MSRAFVKESDGPEAVTRPEPELPPGAKNHVTPAGAARFRARLAAAIAEKREAPPGGLGDAVRTERDAEIRWLERRIATFVETEAPAEPERVGFGTVVHLDGERGARVVAIVGVDEVDPANGAVSWVSPLARALHGARVGDVVTVATPGGDEEWEITEVERR